MKKLIFILVLLLPFLAQAQFKGAEQDKGLTIIVTDGTYNAKNSPQRPPGNVKLRDPIRPLGMVDAIQIGAFVERPAFGRVGFILIFCVNESIGGKQGTAVINGQTYKGIYRLIRQRMSADEQIPPDAQPYRLSGTVFFMGIS